MCAHSLVDHLLAVQLRVALASDNTCGDLSALALNVCRFALTTAADARVSNFRRRIFDQGLKPIVTSVGGLLSRPFVEHASNVLVLPEVYESVWIVCIDCLAPFGNVGGIRNQRRCNSSYRRVVLVAELTL